MKFVPVAVLITMKGEEGGRCKAEIVKDLA